MWSGYASYDWSFVRAILAGGEIDIGTAAIEVKID
jgi:hypothetical protein